MTPDTDPRIPLKGMQFLAWLVVWAVVGWWAWRVVGVLERIP